MPGIELTVLHDFGQYVRGMFITVEEEIQAVLGSEHANRVTKVAAGTHKAVEAVQSAVAQVAAVPAAVAGEVAKVEAVAAAVVAAPVKVESAAKAAVADVKAAADGAKA